MTDSYVVAAALDRFARAESDAAAFAILDECSARLYDHILFTCLRFDYRAEVMSRLYSNREDVSPIGGSKPLPSGPWADRLIVDGSSYIGQNREDLRAVFFDYEALWAVGCESVMNVPVRWHNQTIGTINILGRAGQFDAATVAQFSTYAQAAVPLFMTPI